jgi:hypothetical protein
VIRTRNPSRRAAADLRLGLRGHWDRLSQLIQGFKFYFLEGGITTLNFNRRAKFYSFTPKAALKIHGKHKEVWSLWPAKSHSPVALTALREYYVRLSQETLCASLPTEEIIIVVRTFQVYYHSYLIHVSSAVKANSVASGTARNLYHNTSLCSPQCDLSTCPCESQPVIVSEPSLG